MTVPDQRRQFRVLYRDFLTRIVDLELLSSRGDLEKLLGQFVALLAAFSFTFLIGAVPKYIASALPHAELAVRAWGEEELLIAASMAIAGLFAVLAWNNVLPDRRDSLILGVLPVRARTLFVARASAIATALGVSVLAVNCFTGLAYPQILIHSGSLGLLRSFSAYWTAVLSAGLFVFCTMLAAQGVASQLLPYRLFLKVSAFLQLAAFFVLLAGFFLKPSFPSHAGAEFLRQPLYYWLPSFWFFGLMQQLNGSAPPLLTSLAARAAWALAISASLALLTAALAYSRNIRRIVEQPDIAPSDRARPAARWGSWLAARCIPRTVERAIVLFTARTIARSRQHRLLIAAYGGIGLAIALAYCRQLIYGPSLVALSISTARWDRPNVPLMISSLVLLVFAVLGARAVFALPTVLNANWIFRVTQVHSPSHYFAGIRKSVFALAAGPICITAAVTYLVIWPVLPALQHTVVLFAAAVLLVSRSLEGFQKLPFACSYLPGKANINVKLGIYALLFLLLAEMGVNLEFWALNRAVAWSIVFGILLACAIMAHRHWHEFAHAPYNQIQFEDLPVTDVNPIDLHGSSGGTWSGTGFNSPELPPPSPSPTFPSIMRSRLITLSDAPLAPEPLDIRTRLEQTWADLRHGARILTRSPGFAAAAILIIALGIGGNTALYSMIHGFLAKPAPGVKASGMVVFGTTIHGHLDDPGENSYPAYLEYTARTQTMQSLAATRFSRFNLGLSDGTWQVRGLEVTGNYFRTLGMRLAMGRDFTADEARGAGPLTAIIAWHVWQNQFHAAPDAIGSSILINGQPATVIGVAAEGFRGLEPAPHFEICVPLEAWFRGLGAESELISPARHGYNMVGRLADGASLSDAQAEMNGISQLLEREFHENLGRGVLLAAYPTVAFGPLGGPQSRLFQALLLAAGLITLLIVCANVANLMLTRALSRRQEIAIRLALGAPWTRVARVLLAEGLVLSLAACAAALLFTAWITRIVGALMPPIESGARFQLDLSPDWKVAGYALALAVLCTLAVTLVPVVRLWRGDLQPGLKGGSRGRRPRLAAALVVGQLALCFLLASGGAIAWRTLSAIDTEDVFIVRDHLLLAAITTAGAQQPHALLERIRDRLESLPNVTSVSWALAAPPDSHSWKGAPVNSVTQTQGEFVGPHYLTTLGVHLLAGRDLEPTDRTSAVINRKLADALWPGQSALGRTLSLPTIATVPIRVVGVAPDAPYSGVGDGGGYTGVGRAARLNFVFLPDSPESRQPGQSTFHVRYTGNRASLPAEIRAAIHDVDPTLPVFGVRTMNEEWATFTGPFRLIGNLVQIFAIASLLLAAIGLYAVVSFQTARRKREFGIRAALGATPRDAVRTALRGGALLTSLGMGLGLALSLIAARAAHSLLFGLAPLEPTLLLVIVALLCGVDFVACYIPARRAAAIDPVRALREDS